MNPELLTCRRLTAGLLYPPIQPQPSEMSRLYADLTETYPYQTLQHLPDGIRMANPDGDCLVQLNRTQVNDNVMYFQASKEKCMNIFSNISTRFSIQQYLSFGVKLLAFLPMSSSDSASEFLKSKAFALGNEKWDVLGPGRKGAGMRIVLQQDGIIDLRIEPFFNDLSELYVELDIQHPEPFNDLGQVSRWMDETYDYTFQNVKSFLASMR